MNIVMMLMTLVQFGACQDQMKPIEQPGGTRVHVLTCTYAEPMDVAPAAPGDPTDPAPPDVPKTPT